MLKIFLIFIGSGTGGVCRYMLDGYGTRLGKGWVSLPVGTLLVNVIGCFVIGVLAAYFATRGKAVLAEEYRIGLTVGLVGGFTTFSAFGLETFRILGEHQAMRAGVYVALSVGLGVAAVWAGHRAAALWLG